MKQLLEEYGLGTIVAIVIIALSIAYKYMGAEIVNKEHTLLNETTSINMVEIYKEVLGYED